MPDNVVVQLIVFFVATAMTIVSSHIGLIRLIANVGGDAKGEKVGVLVVIECALVILIGGPIPIATRLIHSSPDYQFAFAAWFVPLATLSLAVLDLVLTMKNKQTIPMKMDCYYRVVAFGVVVLSALLLILHLFDFASSIVLFFAALSLTLAVIVAQFLKSALRLAGFVM